MNGVIDKAAEAGIKVLAFDSISTSPNCWTMDFDFLDQGKVLAQYVVDRLGGKGNIIVVRGISGSAPELAIYEGQMSVLANYPDIKVLATVFGEASDTVAQKAVATILPSMPHLDAVLNQGGDGFGTAQAFADAGRPTPIIIGGNRAEFIQWWLKQKEENGYETISLGSTPGIGGAALWTAVNILEGKDVPKKMSLPCFLVTQETVDEYADMKPGTVISPVFTNEYVVKNIIEPFRDK